MKNDTIRDEARDPRHELLCRVVFGEATADEVREIEAALETSAALREQKAELESTLALVRGAYGESTSDELSSDRLEAVLAAAGGSAEAAAPEPVAAGRAWYQGPATVALAFAAASLAIAGVWWTGQLEGEAPTEDLLARLGDGSDRDRDDGDSARLPHLRGIGYSGADGSVSDAGEPVFIGPGDVAAFGVPAAGESRGLASLTDEAEVQLDQDALRVEEKTMESLGQRVRRLELSVQAEAEAKSREGAFAGYSTMGSADSTALQFDAPTTAGGAVLLSAESSDSGVQFEAGRSVFSLDPSGAVDGAAVAAAQPPAASPGGPPASVDGAAPNQWIAGANTTHRVPYLREVPAMRRGASGGGGLAVPPPDASALTALGYGGGSESSVARDRRGRYEDARSSSDDFFLGRGKSAATDPDEVTRHDRTTYRVVVPPKRLPNERPRDMFFRFWGDNPFVIADRDAQSTFAADVDTASFTLARRMLREGYLPPREQVRTEEFVNFARADLAPPTEGTFALHGELAPSPFGGPTDRWLLRVGLRAAEIDRDARPPLALTFVVDTSGSMKEDNRLELVKHAMRLLVGELDARDSIAIVRFSNQASEVLPPTSAAARDVIETALFQLQPDGSTNAEAGLKLGYGLAERTLAEGVQTRVVFLSDGVANVGQTDQDRIAADVASSAARGIFLNTIGVGLANHNDVFLEQMANEGQGVCDYVGDAKDARRAIVERFVGSFVTVAKDVKIQVEFDPQQVLRWRQLGYENRAVADRDFRNDAVDAGEIGAGHQVACLYEIELPSGYEPAEAALATLRVRWKPVATGEAQPLQEAVEIERSLPHGEIAADTFRGASKGFRRAALSAQLAECLRRSTHARGDSMEGLGRELAQLLSEDRAEDTATIADMTKRSIDLGLAAQIPAFLVGDPDAAHRQAYYDALIESLGGADNPVADGSDHDAYESRIRELIERDRTPRGH